jgi:hypothetical protein
VLYSTCTVACLSGDQADIVHFKEVCHTEHTIVEATLAKMVVYESTGEVPHPMSSYGRMWSCFCAYFLYTQEHCWFDRLCLKGGQTCYRIFVCLIFLHFDTFRVQHSDLKKSKKIAKLWTWWCLMTK